MTAALRRTDSRRVLLFMAMALAVVVAWLWLLRGTFYRHHPGIAEIGAAIDILIALPFLFWLVSGRTISMIRRELVVVCLVSIGLALAIIPGALESAASLIWVLELVLIAAAISRLRASLRSASPDQPVEDRIRDVSRDLIPFRPAADALASELALLTFAFARKKTIERGASRHQWKDSDGWFGVVVGISLMVIAESIAVHLWLHTKVPVLAWVILALELYGLVWLFGDARALGVTGMRIDDEQLHFQFGLRWRGSVPVSQIESVEPYREDVSLGLNLALIESPDLVVTFREPFRFVAVYGIRRRVRTVGIRVERSTELMESLIDRNPALLRPAPSETGGPPDTDAPPVQAGTEEPPPPASRRRMSREAWLRTKPDYVPLEDWLKSKPPWVD